MNFLKLVLFTAIFGTAFSANAMLLSDVHEFNASLISDEPVGFHFNLADHGYNHLTDTITNIKLSFNFHEIVENEENLEQWEDMSSWEFIIFYSWIFDRRSVFADIDTGILTFERGWIDYDGCQFYDDFNQVCVENLGLYGNMSSSLAPYTENLWLGEARLDAKITRISITEPTSIFLLSLGLIGLGLRRDQVKSFL